MLMTCKHVECLIDRILASVTSTAVQERTLNFQAGPPSPIGNTHAATPLNPAVRALLIHNSSSTTRLIKRLFLQLCKFLTFEFTLLTSSQIYYVFSQALIPAFLKIVIMASSAKQPTLNVNLDDLAKMIDHSLLHPTMTDDEVLTGLEISKKYGVATGTDFAANADRCRILRC